VLVIDDDPSARIYVRRAAPEGWTVLEAGDAREGLALARRHLDELKLVILDIDLQGGGDGRVLCAQLRELSLSLKILPFTGQGDKLLEMEAMGCLPPITKPIRATDFTERLQTALDHPAGTTELSPLVRVICDQSVVMDKLMGDSPHVIRVAVYASSPVKRGGLVRMLASAAAPAEAVSPADLRAMLRKPPWTAIVIDADDADHVRSLAREFGVPLILVASPTARLRGLDWPEVAGVLQENALLGARLAETLDALAAGRPVVWGTDDDGAAGDILVPPAIAQRFADTGLAPRLVELLWLDHEGKKTRQIAERMGVTPETVGNYWTRACAGLDCYSREDARVWVRKRLAAQHQGE
jgi:DNA-binding NarL/FixJ family response regulator